MKKIFKLENLDCANCASKIERAIQKLEGVNNVTVNFMTTKMNLDLDDKNSDITIEEIKKLINKIEPDVTIKK
ncbi:MAG: heavy-metal-associated domain-containing protein [Leptotrichiaceae bacterium]|nr:heavy-metal-associated domain-containing protein [Leptotrichiaceae bacterium]MBP7101301.1 heavy-metal-associated domain-containing protein [Leptotrichiaceae bacterium]MBP7725030.1 heavy-metal-associated domain-containing protein [Leptotrichiaceae bacterium]